MRSSDIIIIFMAFSLIVLYSCSPSEETARTDKEEVYVFDEVPEERVIIPPQTGEYPVVEETYYVVQIGAFTTKERAENFAEESQRKILNELSINYSDKVNLYVVQIIPFYKSRQEAEIVRDNLKQMEDFNDAWIITINK